MIGVVTLVGWRSLAAAQPGVGTTTAEGAPPSPRLVLQVGECGDREEAVRAVVGVEVGDLLLERGAPGTETNDRLSLLCEGAVASIEAQAAFAHTPLRRSIDLGAFPADAAARALALAGLETLAEVSPVVQRRLQDRARGPVPSAATEGAASAPPTPEVPPLLAPVAGPPASEVRVTLSGAWRDFAGNHGLSLWGGQAGVERTIGERWNGALDLDLGSGRRNTELGVVRVRTASVGGFWELRARRDWFTGLVGVGGRAGLVNLSGRSNDDSRVVGESVVRPWVGPALRARAILGRGMWVAVAAVESGVAVRGAEGVVNDDTAVALRGPWLAIGAGFGIRL